MREAPAIPLIEALLGGGRDGAGLRSGGDDGRARPSSGRSRPSPTTSYDALKGADALAIVTEWNEFREPDFERMQEADEDAGHLRRPQHLQPRADARARLHLLLDGTAVTTVLVTATPDGACLCNFEDVDVVVDNGVPQSAIAVARLRRPARRLMSRLVGILTDPLLSVVMPVYNERATIEEIIRRVLAVPLRIAAHRRRRWVDGRDAGDPDARCSSELAFKLLLQPRNAGQGRGAAARLPGSDRRPGGHPGRRPRVLARGVSAADRADLPGARRRRLRLAVPRPAPRVPVHALPRQPAADARHQRALQHDAHRHGDLLQGDADRGAAVDDARSPNGFGIEPELTAKIFKRGYRVYEVPITYDGRGYDEGKKITWRDGFVALWVLLKYRFTE